MDKKVYQLLNDQINKEFYSAYLYLEIANYYEAKGLDGFANWYEIQAKEEQDHAMLFYRYLHNNGQQVVLEGIAKPETHFSDLIGPLKAALGHEQYVTGLINAIYAAAIEAKDYRTVQFLDWFIKEQGEEEKNSADQITKMELYGGDARSLYMLNSELLSRTYTAPSLVLPNIPLGTKFSAEPRTRPAGSHTLAEKFPCMCPARTHMSSGQDFFVSQCRQARQKAT